MSTEYTQYIAEHKANVRKAFDWLRSHGVIDQGLANEMSSQIMAHDLSKYGEDEYDAYDAYFYGKSESKEVEEAFNYAWLRHIHENPHHWQYWVLQHDDEPMEALRMPENYAIEMICDWWSFSFKTGDLSEIFGWYEKHKGMLLHKDTREFVEACLGKIKVELEKEKENG